MGLLPVNPRESLLPLELEEALELRRPVMMEYLDGNEARTHRMVEPRTIRRRKGELMLIAHCHLRQAQRTFKVERIVGFTRLEETVAAESQDARPEQVNADRQSDGAKLQATTQPEPAIDHIGSVAPDAAI